jgi:hypothetical protein
MRRIRKPIRAVVGILLALLGSSPGVWGQTKTYTVAGKSYTIQVDPDTLLVSSAPGTSARAMAERAPALVERSLEAQAKVAGARAAGFNAEARAQSITVSLPNLKGGLTRRSKSLSGQHLLALAQELPDGVHVPFRVSDRNQRVYRVLPLGSVTMRFKQAPDAAKLEEIRNAYELSAADKADHLGETYTFRLAAAQGASNAELFLVQAKIQQRYGADLRWVQPDLGVQVHLAGSPAQAAAVEPNDNLFARQWHLGDSNGGLKLRMAWAMSKGDPNLKIAIIDNGIDIDHEDLKGRSSTR